MSRINYDNCSFLVLKIKGRLYGIRGVFKPMLCELVDSQLQIATYIHMIWDISMWGDEGGRGPLGDPPLGVTVLSYCREDDLQCRSFLFFTLKKSGEGKKRRCDVTKKKIINIMELGKKRIGRSAHDVTWTDLWWWPVYACLAVAACSIPWWSPPGIHPLTQMCCWTLGNPRLMRMTSASRPSPSRLQAASPASPCSCGKTPAHPGTWAPPTGCWSRFLVCRSGNRSSTFCSPPPHSCRAASGSPAAAAGGPRARRDSSAPAPPSTSRPRCRPGERALSQML